MKKGTLTNILLILVFLIGLSLLLYPSVSDYWNSLHQSRAVAEYASEVAKLDNKEYALMREAAKAHNDMLQTKSNLYYISEEEKAEYDSLLNVSGKGIIGYIEIPSITVSLPIYHGVAESVLQIAVGHIPWSSLPIGGEGTHAVLSGHRGLPSAKLFTSLDKLRDGDLFLLQVLDETLTYEVDQILIVLPEELEALKAEEGKDLCTLVTCTPYGINSHRLLVRGHRVENQREARNIRITAEASRVDPLMVAPVIAVPMGLLLLLWLMLVPPSRDDFD